MFIKSLWQCVYLLFIPYETVCLFLMGPLLFLINWSLVKMANHKLIFGTIWVHKFLMEPWVYFYGTLPISHKMIFSKICVHKLIFGQIWVDKFIMEPWVYFLWDPCYFPQTELWQILFLINWSLVQYEFINSLWTVSIFFMGPFLFLIKWSLVKNLCS